VCTEELKGENNEQRLRARPTPPQVSEFLGIANSIPQRGFGLVPDVLDEIFAWWSPHIWDQLRDMESARRWLKYMKEDVLTWEDPAKMYILTSDSREVDDLLAVAPRFPRLDTEQHAEIAHCYGYARRALEVLGIRNLLAAIADQNRKTENASNLAYRIPATLFREFSLRMVEASGASTPKVERSVGVRRLSRRAVIEPKEPLNQFLEQVELERIKRCRHDKCERIFWAGRLDRTCCSEPCRNAYKQKRHRAREAQNRPYRKGLFQKGTLRDD
jgi:hypothetical protein